MAARFPQISTHRLSLGTAGQCVEAGGKTRAWLLGRPAGIAQTRRTGFRPPLRNHGGLARRIARATDVPRGVRYAC